MNRNGILAGLIAKYSYFGLDDTWASYEQMEEEQKWRWLTGTIGGLVFALGLTLWQAGSLRQRKRVEAALRESEERLRFTQQVAGIGTFDWNFETGVNMWTPELEALYGLPRGFFPATQEAWEELVHPDDRALAVQKVQESYETGAPVEAEWRIILPDGRVRWLFARWQVFKNAAGKPLRMMGVNMDVTARKYIEEELRKSEERFRLAVQATNDAIWDIDLAIGNVSWNETYATLYGRPPETTSKSWQWWIDRIHPEDRERTSGGLHAAVSGSESTWTGEYRFQRVDGTWAYIHDRAYIARDPSGSAWRVIGAMQDLTQPKRVEAELRESEERFRRVFEEGPLGLALVTRDYRFVKVNGALCQMVGYSETELRKKSFIDITHPDDLRKDAELAERLFSGEIPLYTLQKRYVKKNREIIWINLIGSIVHDKDGAPSYGLAMIEDITERRRAQEIENQLALELAASRDEIRALAASLMRAQEDERRRVSRELHDHTCHQLGSLAREISNLANGLLPSENVRAKLEEIRAHVVKTAQETQHIAHQMHTAILDDLGLVYSLKDLCRQVSEEYPDIALDFENRGLPASIPREVSTCLYRVAEEGLQNIAKHSRAKCVSVCLDFETEAVALTIQDDGVSFDANTVKGHGGLGLINMSERAHLINGKLTITGQPGHGTQIALKVPLPLQRPIERPRVLVADDHPVVLEEIRSILAMTCEIVETVADGRALVEAALRLQPDLTVVDITMPLLTGIEAAAQIKKSLPEMKLLFVTMHASTAYVQAAFEAGGTGYVLKSGLREELTSAVQSVLDGRIYISHGLSAE